jgi:hypothetical protein
MFRDAFRLRELVGLHFGYFLQLSFLQEWQKGCSYVTHGNDVRIEDRPEIGPRFSIS